MPCLLTNLWKQGVSDSEASSVTAVVCAVTAGVRGDFPSVRNTTSELCDLRGKEEPHDLGLVTYFYVIRFS